VVFISSGTRCSNTALSMRPYVRGAMPIALMSFVDSGAMDAKVTLVLVVVDGIAVEVMTHCIVPPLFKARRHSPPLPRGGRW
jgi:hypothetical protein